MTTDVRHEMLSIAEVMARRSSCPPEEREGCVLTHQGRVLMTGCSQQLTQEYKVSAVMDALSEIHKLGISTRNTTMYCTQPPTPYLVKYLYMTGVKRVYYDAKHEISFEAENLARLIGLEIRALLPHAPGGPVSF